MLLVAEEVKIGLQKVTQFERSPGPDMRQTRQRVNGLRGKKGWAYETQNEFNRGIKKFGLQLEKSIEGLNPALKVTIFDKQCTVKPVYNNHPRDPKFGAVVDR